MMNNMKNTTKTLKTPWRKQTTFIPWCIIFPPESCYLDDDCPTFTNDLRPAPGYEERFALKLQTATSMKGDGDATQTGTGWRSFSHYALLTNDHSNSAPVSVSCNEMNFTQKSSSDSSNTFVRPSANQISGIQYSHLSSGKKKSFPHIGSFDPRIPASLPSPARLGEGLVSLLSLTQVVNIGGSTEWSSQAMI